MKMAQVRPHNVPIRGWLSSAACMVVFALPGIGLADDAVPATQDSGKLQQLIDRLDRQDAKIKQQDDELRALREKVAKPATAPAAAPDVSSRLDKQQAEIDSVKSQLSDAVKSESEAPAFPQLQFHVFGDIDYHAGNLRGDNNATTLGEFDVFLSGQIAPELSVLTETVVSANSQNEFGVEIERLMLSWQQSEYFNLDVGRYHEHTSYYNTTYHHGTWFQTAVGRPSIVNFEDSGGVIPDHQVGASAHGTIPLEGLKNLGLQYFAEIGSGRQYLGPNDSGSPVANIYPNNGFKATNIGLVAHPEAIEGLEVGGGFYHDLVTANNTVRTGEVILHGHAVYKNSDWELLAEGFAIQHNPHGMDTDWSTAGYAQIARKFGVFTPYARFTFFNGNDADPVWRHLGNYGRHYGPEVGLRYDVSTFLALKLQYDYIVNHGPGFDPGPAFNPVGPGNFSQVTVQAAFTF